MATNSAERYILPSVVSAATGVPQPTLQTWMQRGRLTNLDANRKGQQGVSRLYSERDVWAIYVIKQLLGMGIEHRGLIALVPTFISDLERNPHAFDTIRWSYDVEDNDDASYVLADEVTEIGGKPILFLPIGSMVSDAREVLLQVLKARGIQRPKTDNLDDDD